MTVLGALEPSATAVKNIDDGYRADGKPLTEFPIGTIVSGTITKIFHNRVWVDIGARRDGSMSLAKQIAKKLKVGDEIHDCAVVVVNSEVERIIMNLSSATAPGQCAEHPVPSDLCEDNAMLPIITSSKSPRTGPDTSKTLQFYRIAAEKFAPDDSRRYGWSHKYSTSFLKDAYVELAQLIPRGATRVLDLGCGGGEFAEVLFKQRPELRYLGVDLVPSHVAAARRKMSGVEGYEFECGDFWTFLFEHNPENVGKRAAEVYFYHDERDLLESPSTCEGGYKWDFVISFGSVFSHCKDTVTGLRDQLQLLDAIECSAQRGFILICHGADSGHGICMDAARRRVVSYAAASETPGNQTDIHPWFYVSPVGGHESKPCLKKIKFKHRLMMLLR